VIIQISEIPEWGAMVAQGTPHIRTYPFMVMGPAVAFFIAILGLNAFGEGLRRIFDRWPFSTAFVLKKRMLAFIAIFILVSAFIFQQTNASVSYQQVAASFDEASVTARYEELKIYNNIARENENSPVMDYIVQKFREYEVQTGWAQVFTSYHYYPVETTLVRPASEPILEVGTRNEFNYSNEFAFLNEGCAGTGRASGPIVLLTDSVDIANSQNRRALRGKIILILEESFSPELAQTAAELGAEGILVVTIQQPPLQSQNEVVDPPGEKSCPVDQIPVFRITDAVARRIAAENHQDWDQLQLQAQEQAQVQDLELNGKMVLELSDPETVPVPNAIGFIGGYDIDHADEIVVIFTTFDGLGLSEYGKEQVPEDDLAKIAVLLEIIHTWSESQLDPRRSVQFVIWGGEGIEGAYYDLIYGLLETNKLAAKVPTNMNPYINTNPVKPAIWIELGNLSNYPGMIAFSADASQSLRAVFEEAANATRIDVQASEPRVLGVDTGLPNIYIWEEGVSTPTAVPDLDHYVQKGVVLNRTLIQLLRDMQN
jgi:hypothetical protein